jgi:hypothetical protein
MPRLPTGPRRNDDPGVRSTIGALEPKSLLSLRLKLLLALLALTACDAFERVYFYPVDSMGTPYGQCSPGSWASSARRTIWNGRVSGESIEGRVRFTVFIYSKWDHDSLSIACVGSSDTVTVALGPFVHGTATVERVVLQRDSLPRPGP